MPAVIQGYSQARTTTCRRGDCFRDYAAIHVTMQPTLPSMTAGTAKRQAVRTAPRVLVPVLTAREQPAVPDSPAGLELINAWRHYEKELGLLIEVAGLTA